MCWNGIATVISKCTSVFPASVLHTINPGLAPEQILYTIQHAGDEILIFHESFIPLVEKMRAALPTVRQYILIHDEAEGLELGWEALDYEAFLVGAEPLLELPDLTKTFWRLNPIPPAPPATPREFISPNARSRYRAYVTRLPCLSSVALEAYRNRISTYR